MFPEKIVVFRDGVGDGDLGYIDHEVQQLQQCFGNFGGEYSPKLSVVIVQKRINARIFLKVWTFLLNMQSYDLNMHHKFYVLSFSFCLYEQFFTSCKQTNSSTCL